MSQIYNGSFVLGDTSATTLSAGPGIKLDTSIPGTIKISNDETVLWSGTDFSKGGGNKLSATVSLSESVQNFDTILIKSSGNLNSESIYVNPANLGTNGSFQWITLEGNNNTWVGMRGYFTDDTHLKIFGGFSTALPSVFTGGGWWNYKNVYEVVGINRIAGGN